MRSLQSRSPQAVPSPAGETAALIQDTHPPALVDAGEGRALFLGLLLLYIEMNLASPRPFCTGTGAVQWLQGSVSGLGTEGGSPGPGRACALRRPEAALPPSTAALASQTRISASNFTG